MLLKDMDGERARVALPFLGAGGGAAGAAGAEPLVGASWGSRTGRGEGRRGTAQRTLRERAADGAVAAAAAGAMEEGSIMGEGYGGALQGEEEGAAGGGDDLRAAGGSGVAAREEAGEGGGEGAAARQRAEGWSWGGRLAEEGGASRVVPLGQDGEGLEGAAQEGWQGEAAPGSTLPCACTGQNSPPGGRSLHCTAGADSDGGRGLGRRGRGGWAEEIYQRNLERRAAQFPSFSSLLASLPAWEEQRAPWAAAAFVHYYTIPLYPCSTEERLGSWGEGGKWICGAYKLNRSSIVYSVGSQGETSFEEDLHRTFGVVSHTFDPTLVREQVARLRRVPFLEFHDLGWSGTTREGSKMMRAADVMELLGHTYVDILKIDCEQCETGVIDDLLTSYGKYRADSKDYRVLFGEILVEFHSMGRPKIMAKQLQQMEDLGYRLFHNEANYLCPDCIELAYIHASIVRPA